MANRHMPHIDDSTLWGTLPSPPPSTTAAIRGKHCRCGKPSHAAHRRQHPLGHPTSNTSIHNGSKSRETLPVWQTATCRTSTTAPSGTPYRHHLHPQRQQIATAPSGTPYRHHLHPQRQQIAGNTAGVANRHMPHIDDSTLRAPYLHHLHPQRQQIARNAAGVANRHMPHIDDSTLWDTLPSPPPSTTAANRNDSAHRALQSL